MLFCFAYPFENLMKAINPLREKKKHLDSKVSNYSEFYKVSGLTEMNL